MQVTRRKLIKRGLQIGAGLALTDAFWIEKFFIEIREFYTGAATKDHSNITVVQLSDLHLHSLNYQLVLLTKKLNKLQPDLILITGDAIDKAQNLSLLNDFLNLIDKDINKVAILGNWEYWGEVNLVELNRIYSDHNCILLVNQTIQYTFNNKTISITGTDDFAGGNADINIALTDYKPSDYHIILNHCPQYNDRIAELIDKNIPVDFILSGHTHGGQVNLFGLVLVLPPGSGRYLKGWYDDITPKCYVSKGIGTSVLPVRFGARAEVAVFYLG